MARKLPDGKGPWCTVGQSAEYEPAYVPRWPRRPMASWLVSGMVW